MDDLAKQRLAELAATPVKRKNKEPFVKVHLTLAAKAATASNCRRMTVWLYLLHRSWQLQKASFTVPTSALRKLGVGREVKRRALRDFERAGLIAVKPRPNKNPMVTLLHSIYG